MVAAANFHLVTYTGSTTEIVFLVAVAIALLVVTVWCLRFFAAMAAERVPSPTIACLNDKHGLCDGAQRNGASAPCNCACHRT